jgi:hypothetical protein
MPEIISTSKTDISYILEVTPGTTPATPAFQRLPTTGGGPVGGRSTAKSEVIRTDRQTSELITVDQNVTGDINYELSYAPWIPLLEALMQGTTVTGTETQVDIAVVAASRTFTSAALADFSAVPAGSYVLISGASNAGNNGLFRVESATTLVLTLHAQDAANLVDETAGASIKITWNHTPNSVDTPNSYTFKKEIALATKAYMYYRGCMVNSMAWTFSTGSILTGTMGIVGLTEDVTESAIAGQTTTAVAAYKLMNSVSSLALSSVGLESDVQIESASITYDNNIQPAKAIGTLGAVALEAFTLSCTGDITLYFEDISAYTLFTSDSSFSLSFKFTDSEGNSIVMFMPNCQFATVESPIPGKDNFFMINGTYEALRDPTLGFTMGMNTLAKHA